MINLATLPNCDNCLLASNFRKIVDLTTLQKFTILLRKWSIWQCCQTVTIVRKKLILGKLTIWQHCKNLPFNSENGQFGSVAKL